MAPNGHAGVGWRCLLLRVKRTCRANPGTSVFDPEQIFANGNVSRNAAGGLPPGRRNSSLISRGIAATRRWRQRADDRSIADPPGKPVEDRRLLLNEVAERRSAVHAVKECAQAWPAVARGRNACISQVHMG